MILNALVERLKGRSKHDVKGRATTFIPGARCRAGLKPGLLAQLSRRASAMEGIVFVVRRPSAVPNAWPGRELSWLSSR